MARLVQKDNIAVNVFTKSRNKKCSLWTWKSLRDTKPNNSSKALEVGILAHELAAKKLADMFNIDREINDIEERFSMEVIYQTVEMVNSINFSAYFNNMQVIGIESSFSILLPEVAENFRFNGRFDVESYMEIDGQQYSVIDDFKSGFYISTEVDEEAILYAYAAYKRNGGYPVIFRRISLLNGKTWSHEFSKESLESIENIIIFKLTHWKREMESEMIPEYSPGSHCLYCPYISKCQGRKDISNLQKKYKAAIWAKQLAKKLESEVKSGAQEVLSHIETPLVGEEAILLPFLDNKYGAVAKTTESFQLKGRKVSKKDLIKLLNETGELGNFIDLIDIKFNEELSTKIETEYKVPMKRVVSTTISLVENKEEE